jgi:prophage regulatory protein
MTDDKFLRSREVVEKSGLSISTVYRLIKLGRFPPAQRIGLQAVGWRVSAIDAWMAGTWSNSSPTRQEAPVVHQ